MLELITGVGCNSDMLAIEIMEIGTEKAGQCQTLRWVAIANIK